MKEALQTEEIKIPKRILNSLIASVSAGVVPRVGAPYIAIGREEEVKAILSDLALVSEGGSSMRFIIGKYGSGKSFLMQLVRGYALERGFVCADADLSPERRIYGTKGSGRATYRELLKNLSTKSSPDSSALPGIFTKWFSDVRAAVMADGTEPGSAGFDLAVERRILSAVRELQSEVGGFDFSLVITKYYRASVDTENAAAEELKSRCLKWLRGEYATKSEAKSQLSVTGIIDDDNFYEYLKLWAVFFRKIGYSGFVVFIDECVNLYKISNRISRENNYEKILSMFNDTLQNKAEGLSLILGGTPQFLEDTRRGLFSYEALRSRLYDGRFAAGDYKNLVGPVIRLRRLSDDELYALTLRLLRLHAQNYGYTPRVSREDLKAFLDVCLGRAGADTMITPREITRDFLQCLNILMQNEEATFEELLRGGAVTLKPAGDPSEEDAGTGSGDFDPEEIEL